MTIIDLIDAYNECEGYSPNACRDCLLNKGELCGMLTDFMTEYEKYYCQEEE